MKRSITLFPSCSNNPIQFHVNLFSWTGIILYAHLFGRYSVFSSNANIKFWSEIIMSTFLSCLSQYVEAEENCMLVTVHLVIHPCVEFALIAYYLSLNKFHCLAAGPLDTTIKWKAIGILCRWPCFTLSKKLPWELQVSKIHTKFQDHTLSCAINSSTLEVCVGIVDDRKFMRCVWCKVTSGGILIQSFMRICHIRHVFFIGERHLDVVILWICM